MTQVGLLIMSKQEAERLIQVLNNHLSQKHYINESMRENDFKLIDKLKNLKLEGVLI